MDGRQRGNLASGLRLQTQEQHSFGCAVGLRDIEDRADSTSPLACLIAS